MESGLTQEEAEQKEKELILLYKSNNRNYGYNIENGGRVNKVSEETKIKLRNANLGKKKSKESIEKFKSHNIKYWLGKNRPKETIEKVKIGMLKKWQNEEYRTYMKKIHGIAVECIETKETFYSSKEAEKQTNINHSSIIQCCKGNRKTAGGYHWRYHKEAI